jgi:hypothetical protein
LPLSTKNKSTTCKGQSKWNLVADKVMYGGIQLYLRDNGVLIDTFSIEVAQPCAMVETPNLGSIENEVRIVHRGKLTATLPNIILILQRSYLTSEVKKRYQFK